MLLENKPLVALSEPEFWQYFYAIADGLDVEDEATDIWQCYQGFANVFYDARASYSLMSTAIKNPGTSTVEPFEAYLEFTLAIGNFSLAFQDCYEDIDLIVYKAIIFAEHYETILNYAINLLPNVLSYAFFITDWINRIQELTDAEEFIELAYVVAVIVRKLLFYEYIPD